jgi:hypothetical protein
MLVAFAVWWLDPHSGNRQFAMIGAIWVECWILMLMIQKGLYQFLQVTVHFFAKHAFMLLLLHFTRSKGLS